MTEMPREISGKPPTPVPQRREDVRVAVSLPVLVTVGDRAMPIALRTAEISGGGLLLVGADKLAIDERLRFVLDINYPGRATPPQTPIVGAGTVIRIDQRGSRADHRAVRIDLIEDLERRRLVRLVFELQRIQRRKRVASA